MPRPTSHLLAGLVLAAGMIAAPAAGAQSLAGSYLAARQASLAADYDAAARYYTQALADDPGNVVLMDNAVLAYVGKGDVARSVAIARQIQAQTDAGQLAELVLLAAAAHEGRFSDVLATLEEGPGFSPLLDGLMRGWALVGLGQMGDALDQFDAMSNGEALTIFAQNHKALALAMAGDFETAEAIMAGDENGSLRFDRSGLAAHAQMLVALDRRGDAIEIIEGTRGALADRQFLRMLERIGAGEAVPFDIVTSPRDGAADVFFAISNALNGEDDSQLALVYARLAQYVRPGDVRYLLRIAELLVDQGQHDLAIRALEAAPKDSELGVTAELQRADSLFESDREEAAIEVIKGLARTYPTDRSIQTALGDALRRTSRFEEAVAAYDAAVALIDVPQESDWFLYYARGIALERIDAWDRAEADLRRALELQEDEPLVLNYLGYSLVEKRVKLDEALRMIERAVEQRPQDGYITDSLGWVLYRLDRFDEAVEPMERAVELMPLDPIINDHLGDVYWVVGRQREARFQWRRAISFDPEEEDLSRIRRKLEVGLDAVLREEEAEAAQTANGN